MTWVSATLDGVLAAVLVICVVLGFKRGFVRSVVQMIGSVAAMLVSFFISGPIAQGLFDAFFRTGVRETVASAIGGEATASVSTLQREWGAIFGRLPELFRNGLNATGSGTPDALSATVSKQGAATVGTAADAIADNLIAPICVALLQVLLFVVLFLIVSLLIRLVGRALDKIFSSLPLVRQVNTALGGAAGLLRGAVWGIVLCSVLHIYMTMAGSSSFVTAADLDATWWTGWVMDINPLF